MTKILTKVMSLLLVISCSDQDHSTTKRMTQENAVTAIATPRATENLTLTTGLNSSGNATNLPHYAVSWRPVVPADFYKLEFLLPTNFASKCTASEALTFVFEHFEKGDLIFNSELTIPSGESMPSISIDPIFIEMNDFHLVKIRTQKTNCLPEKLQLSRSTRVLYQKPDHGHNWSTSSIKDFDNTSYTFRAASSKLPAKWSFQNKKNWKLYFFNPTFLDGEQELSAVSPEGRTIQIDQRNSNKRWIFIKKIESNLPRQFLVNPGTTIGSVSRVGSIGLVPSNVSLSKNISVTLDPQYILKSFRYISNTDSTDPVTKAANNSKAIQNLIDQCQTMNHGCTIVIEGRVETDRPIFVSSATHITGLYKQSKIISRNPSIGFNGSVFSFGLVTRFSFARLYENDRFFNKTGEAISEIQANSRYVPVNANPDDPNSPLLDSSYKVGSQIMIVDRFHPGCITAQNCVNGMANWYTHLGTIPKIKLKSVKIEPPQVLSLNVIESISPDRRSMTLRYPVIDRIEKPLLVNYSDDTYVNPSDIPDSTQKQFFSQNSSISDLTLSSTFAPALVQGCLNCLFQNIEMGIDGLVPRSMIYGNAAVRSLYSDITGRFSRHSIELAIGSEKSIIKRVNVNQVSCTEPNCSLLYKPNKGEKAECLPMSIGLTERAAAISMENIVVKGFSGLTECVLTALTLTGNDHKLSDILLVADTSLAALEIRDSEKGIVMNRIKVDAGKNLETAYGFLESTKNVSISNFNIRHSNDKLISNNKSLRQNDYGMFNKIEQMSITYEP